MRPLIRLLLFVALAVQAESAVAGLYKCEGPQGKISYSDKPCVKDQESKDVSRIAAAKSKTGPGETMCRKVQRFGTKVARAMRRGAESYNVMDSIGGTGAIDAVALQIVNYVYSFKSSSRYGPGRIGGLAYSKCMGGGFPFPEQGAGGGGSGSGTGFVVDRAGHIVTNAHVVKGCASVAISGQGKTHPATVVARDRVRDLALLQAEISGKVPVSFRSAASEPALGEPVIVAGYPLKGLLTDDLQVTTGSVSATSGIRNDQNMLQVTAPVQPGNSGGPLFDAGGSVIGVVVAKLNAMAVARKTGDIPQNINFAVQGRWVRKFLSRNQVSFATTSGGDARSQTEVAADARRSVVPVLCR